MAVTSKKGFTLIELMIVVAIIGILAAIAIPKFGDLVRKSREASTKGSLGAIRSAVGIYFTDNEGFFPQTQAVPGLCTIFVDALTNGQKYLNQMPTGTIPNQLSANHITNAAVVYRPAGDTDETVAAVWDYFGSTSGKVILNCIHRDTKGVVWSTW